VKKLTRGQIAVLIAATVPMVGFGVLGAVGTYSNVTSVFHRSATALGVIAAGEGATLVLALVLVGLTMLGQSSPLPVRIGLWLVPLAAAVTGSIVAPTARDAVVFAITPMAMTVSAEGLGLVARRVVVYRTGVDAEAQRRNASLLRRIAYHQARAQRHPKPRVRKRSERIAWQLARRVGEGDVLLGDGLLTVQRGRITNSADAALGLMLSGAEVQPLVSGDEAVGFEETVDTALTVAADAQPVPEVQPQPSAQPAPEMQPQPDAQPQPETAAQPTPSAQPAPEVQPQPSAQPTPDAQPAPEVQPQPSVQPDRKVTRMRTPEEMAQLLADALVVNAKSLRDSDRKASLRTLQKELGVGQKTAQLLQAQLPDILAPAPAEADPHAKEA
jgi:hypothetical protein